MKITAKDPKYFEEIPGQLLDKYPDIQLIQLEAQPGKLLNDKAIVVSEGQDPSIIVKHFLELNARHWVQKNKAYFQDDIERSARMIADPKQFLDTPIESTLGEVSSKIELEFAAPKHKDNLIKKANEFVAKGGNHSLSESARAVVEELYMNAVYSAPREAKRQGLAKVAYSGSMVAKLTLAFGKDRLAIFCEDPLGALDSRRFIQRMRDVYQQGAGSAINLGNEGGAGLGCVIMFEHASTLFLGVVPGKVTVFGCLIPIGLNYRQRAAVGRGIHWI